MFSAVLRGQSSVFGNSWWKLYPCMHTLSNRHAELMKETYNSKKEVVCVENINGKVS